MEIIEMVQEKVHDIENMIRDVVFLQHRNELTISELAQEMKDFKDEMKDFKEENLEERRNMNKQWGALANKMGTIVEDLVSPAIQPLVQRYFGVEPIEMGIRIKRKRESLKIELDAIAITDEKVFVFEVKSSPQIDYVRYFVGHQIPLFKELFKEHGGRQIVPIFASISIDKEIIAECTRLGVYAMAYREWDYMDLLNFEDLTPQGT
jgi:hypothetical protein